MILPLTKRTCNISNKICRLHRHHHIRSGVRCFLWKNTSSSFGRSLSNVIFENAVNDRNNEVDANTSGTQSCLSFESERNKKKRDR